MSNPELPPDLPQLNNHAWLVDRRSRVQQLCLELYEYLQKNPIAVQNHWRFFSPLLASAFSLWRAVFLADTSRTWPDIYQHARTFLKILIEDNAINYPQDRTTRAYSASYYLDNAKYRLAALWDEMPNSYEPEYRKKYAAFWRIDIDERDPAQIFDLLFESLILTFRYHQNYR